MYHNFILCKPALLTLLFAALFSCNSFAQTGCSIEKLTGTWKEIISMPGVIESLDSLKENEAVSGKQSSFWEFRADLKYRHRHVFQRSRYKRNGVYYLDSATCEIILGRKKNAREKSNLEIILIDNRYLIYKSDNNPKGYFTHLLTRVEE